MYGMMKYQREYDEYHEGYDHGVHTHEGYNFGAYGRNDGDGRWRHLRSMTAFHGNGSYGDKPIVERRLMYSGDIGGDISLSLIPYLVQFPRVDDYDFNIANCVSFVLEIEDRRSMLKGLGHILEDLSISLSLNPSSLCYEASLEKLKSLLDSYNK
ncbi:hypothetical protein M9H77_06999 [Catharanthus roseus]|uniref:Uncharacterized protein n=1 Tax=Catharanthus roseus TaxID=4058 RepID=A0ACC0BTW6_CATRO|nr:hypothetical protein M9H77_06999 [Catharanthus roseus]